MGWALGLAQCPQAPEGYVLDATDCYDNNANAYPGSTYCGTVHRGDGSFDYDCTNTQTKCGTIYNYSSNGMSVGYEQANGSCKNCNMRCVIGNNTIYYQATIGCGVSGAVCTSLTGSQSGDCDCGTCSNGCPDCGVNGGSYGLCNAATTGVQGCRQSNRFDFMAARSKN